MADLSEFPDFDCLELVPVFRGGEGDHQVRYGSFQECEFPFHGAINCSAFMNDDPLPRLWNTTSKAMA